MGIPLLRGRFFSQRDNRDSPPTILINETMARRYWPGEDPIGARVTPGFPGSGTAEVLGTGGTAEVVGFVGDVRPSGLEREPEPELYLPYARVPVALMTFVVGTEDDPAALVSAVKSAIRETKTELPLRQVATMKHFLSESLRPRRFSLFLIGSFAAMALILAAVGLYQPVAKHPVSGREKHRRGQRRAG